MSSFTLDLKHALRGLSRTPGFTFLAVLSLALGIGVNSAVFTILNSVLLRPLPVREPSRLVRVYAGSRESFSVPAFRTLAREQASVDLAAESLKPLNWTRGEQSQRVTGSIVSGGYFPVLGVQPFMGRLLGPEDDRVPGGHPVAVLSHRFWTRKLEADPSILGRALTLNGHTFTVVGVAAPTFHGDFLGMVPEIWVPLSMQAQAFPQEKRDLLESHATSWLEVLGRLHPGVGRAQAQQTLQALEAGVFQRKLDPDEGHIEVEAMGGLPRAIQSGMGVILPALQAVVLLVLLIACSNVANLQLARAMARRQEVAVRIALGGSRAQLVRQFLTESAVLALLGAGAGLALGALALRAVPSLIPPVGPDLFFDLGMDGRVVSFAVLLSLATGLLFGLAPALQSTRPDVMKTLKEESAGATSRRGLTRRLFVVAQVALSMVLLVASGLFLRSLAKAKDIDPGFERSNMVLFNVDPGTMGYGRDRNAALFEAIRHRAASLPGVRSVALAQMVPLEGGRMETTYQIQGQEVPKGTQEPETGLNKVGLAYFQTLGIPLLSGREFAEGDQPGAPRVAVVNATFAQKVLGGEALGRRLVLDKEVVEIVGVARDVKSGSLGEPAAPMLFRPLAQVPATSLTVHVATTGDPTPFLALMRGIVRDVDPYLPVNELRTMKQHFRLALFPARTGALLLGIFGFLALTLATTGIYGVMAFDSTQRRREIGIRMALGAQIREVVGLIVAQGMRVVCLGLAIGLALAWGLARLLSSLLYGIAATDAFTFAAITALLGGVALLACLIPALRAAQSEPMLALRSE
ncbi:MAG: ABC transporter permease [Acidobacteria bacterium]|nr:ABC transporter permease [Acidobacteriota bacterium]